MSDETATLPAPTTYEEAAALLQRLDSATASLLLDRLSQQGASAILAKLALPRPEHLEAVASVPAASRTRPEEHVATTPETEESEAATRPLPALSEDTLQGVLEAAPDAIVVIDGHGTIVLVNAETERMFGYDRQELLGQKVERLVPVRNRGRHVQQRRGYFQAPHPRAMGSGLALFGLRKDGREVPVEISLSPVVTAQGLLVTSVIRDITERKKHEAELVKAELRYRSLVEEIPAVTFMAALAEGINELYVSPQIVDLLGFSQQEWLDDPVLWHRQLHPEDRERWHREFARTCATAEPFRSVYRFLARDGRVVWVHGEAKVVRDRYGRPMFLQGVAFDITERKEAEENLKDLNRTLEDRIADRTEALKRSNDALAQYGHRVAHEMKKPIRRIFDVLNPMSSSPRASDSAEQRLARIKGIADDMAELIKEMLAYAQVSETVTRFVPTDCRALMREVVSELEKDIELSGAVVSQRSLPTLNAHRESLKAVFRNLVDNAIKYRARTAKRRLKISVSARLQDEEWLFRIKDNGEGIRPTYWQSIFKLFQRNHGENIPGHGIGLSYCQRVIEHHGGKIWVESQPGQGSTFFFTLPAVAQADRQM